MFVLLGGGGRHGGERDSEAVRLCVSGISLHTCLCIELRFIKFNKQDGFDQYIHWRGDYVASSLTLKLLRRVGMCMYWMFMHTTYLLYTCMALM